MSGLRPKYEKGPLTFNATTTANGGNITAGVFVEPDGPVIGTAGKIKVATAGTIKSLGLLIGDLSASDYANADTADLWGNPVVNAHFPPNEGAIAIQGVWVIKAGSNIGWGERVKIGANGLPVQHDSGGAATLGQIVGRCVDPKGIASGAKGQILLGVWN